MSEKTNKTDKLTDKQTYRQTDTLITILRMPTEGQVKRNLITVDQSDIERMDEPSVIHRDWAKLGVASGHGVLFFG